MKHPLHGSWVLKNCILSFSDGRPSKNPYQKGMISYHRNSLMQASLSTHPRAALSFSDLEQGYRLSLEEKAECFDNFLCYAGRYTYTDTDVSHHVELSLNPTIIGTTLVRQYHIEQEQLLLSYEYTVRSNLQCLYQLYWQRSEQI